MLPQHAYRQDAKAVINVERFPVVNVSGVYSASGDNQIVAAPGVDQRIVVTSFTMQNESSNAVTLILRSAETINAWRVLAQNQGDGLSKTFATGYEWKLNENEVLNLNLSSAEQCNCSVEYYIEHWEGI